MIVRIVCIVLAAVLSFGAAEELIVGGLLDGEAQSLVIGTLGLMVCGASAYAAIAGVRGVVFRPRTLVAIACLVVTFHVVLALPPHRIVGTATLFIALALATLLLVDAAPRRSRALR